MSEGDGRLRGPSDSLDVETRGGRDQSNDDCPQYCNCTNGVCRSCNRKKDENGLPLHFDNSEETYGLEEYNACVPSFVDDVFNWVLPIIVIITMIVDYFVFKNKFEFNSPVSIILCLFIQVIAIFILLIITSGNYFTDGYFRNGYFLTFTLIIIMRIIIYGMVAMLAMVAMSGGEGMRKMKIG
tara:strand:- start:289 stop:837 length:549 start_codon:yes stop_codon:yes gene_type:complete